MEPVTPCAQLKPFYIKLSHTLQYVSTAHIHLRALRDKLLCVLTVLTVSLLLQMLKLVPDVHVYASGTA